METSVTSGNHALTNQRKSYAAATRGDNEDEWTMVGGSRQLSSTANQVEAVSVQPDVQAETVQAEMTEEENMGPRKTCISFGLIVFGYSRRDIVHLNVAIYLSAPHQDFPTRRKTLVCDFYQNGDSQTHE